MAYSYKGSISFGLVYIPIKLHAAIKQNDIGFNMIDKQTMSRVKYKKTCVDCGDREVTQKDIVKGYEYQTDNYIIFTDEDFEKIKTQKDKNITIERFVDLNQIDPIFFDKAYFVEPTGAERAYGLLLKAMEQENKAGIAKTVLGTKETLIVLRSRGGQMALNTLFFNDELQRPSFPAVKIEPNIKEIELAKSIIAGMTNDFAPEDYKDEYAERLKMAIEAKIAGKELVPVKEKKTGNNIINLLDALKQSLSDVEKNKSLTAQKAVKEIKRKQPTKAKTEKSKVKTKV